MKISVWGVMCLCLATPGLHAGDRPGEGYRMIDEPSGEYYCVASDGTLILSVKQGEAWSMSPKE